MCHRPNPGPIVPFHAGPGCLRAPTGDLEPVAVLVQTAAPRRQWRGRRGRGAVESRGRGGVSHPSPVADGRPAADLRRGSREAEKVAALRSEGLGVEARGCSGGEGEGSGQRRTPKAMALVALRPTPPHRYPTPGSPAAGRHSPPRDHRGHLGLELEGNRAVFPLDLVSGWCSLPPPSGAHGLPGAFVPVQRQRSDLGASGGANVNGQRSSQARCPQRPHVGAWGEGQARGSRQEARRGREDRGGTPFGHAGWLV